MIVRIVRMNFQEHEIDAFLSLFESRKHQIRSFQGCQHLELWQDASIRSVFFTYSLWDNEEALNHYRFSEFFKDTWSKTKIFFSEKPTAWSVIPKSIADVTEGTHSH